MTGHLLEKKEVTLDNPLYIGKCILKNSNEEMYCLWFNYLHLLVAAYGRFEICRGNTDLFFLNTVGVNYLTIIRSMLMWGKHFIYYKLSPRPSSLLSKVESQAGLYERSKRWHMEKKSVIMKVYCMTITSIQLQVKLKCTEKCKE